MSLHNRIMKLPKRTPGQLDTVMNAAQMAQEADELMADMAAFISVCDLADNADLNWAEELEQRYKAWKERTQ